MKWSLILNLLVIDFNIHTTRYYKNLLAAVSSHNNESNIPGRELRWMIYEKKVKRLLDSFVLDLQLSILNLEMNLVGKTTKLVCI